MSMSAAKCKWCGKAYEQHLDGRPPDAPVPRMPCLGLKVNFLESEKVDEVMLVEARDRQAAHAALERWLEQCGREGATVFASGRSGYVGRIKLVAFVGDGGLTLQIERSFMEDP